MRGPLGGGVIASTGFTPAQIPNLAFWLDGRQQSFSDAAGVVPANAFAGRCRRVRMPGLGANLTAAAAANRPFVNAKSLAFKSAAQLGVSAPAGITLPAQNCTLGLSWVTSDLLRPDTTGPFTDYIQGLLCGAHSADPSTVWGFMAYSWAMGIYYGNGGNLWYTLDNGGPTLKPGDITSAVLRFSPTALDLAWNVNGTPGSAQLVHAIPAGTISNLGIGDRSNRALDAAVSQVTAYGRRISDGETADLLKFLVANPAERFPVQTPAWVIAGDSISRGWTATSRATSWCYLVLAGLDPTPVVLNNTSFQGWTIANVATDYVPGVVPFYNPARVKNVLSVTCGSNDLFNGVTGVTALAGYLAYLDTARAAGWKLQAATLLPRSSVGTPVDFETQRTAFNTGLRAASSHYDSLADVALVAGMGAAGDSDNATNYSDKVHPTDVGHALIAPTYKTAVQALL